MPELSIRNGFNVEHYSLDIDARGDAYLTSSLAGDDKAVEVTVIPASVRAWLAHHLTADMALPPAAVRPLGGGVFAVIEGGRA